MCITDDVRRAMQSLAEAIMLLRRAETEMSIGKLPAAAVEQALGHVESAVRELRHHEELKGELRAAGARVTFPERA